MVSISHHHPSEPPGSGPPGGRGLLLALAGLVIGLGMGVVFTGIPTDTTTATTTGAVASPAQPPTTVATTVTTVEPVPRRLATLVPGLLDTLVASVVDQSGMSVVTVWRPADRSPGSGPLPAGVLMADAGRRWLAAMTKNRYTDGSTLWVGNAAYMEPVTQSVTSMTWHARLPSQLAWVEDTEAGATLRRARFLTGRFAAQPVDVAPVDDASSVVWWNDVGITLLNTTTQQLTLYSEQGEALETVGASEVVAAGANYLAIVDGTGEPMLLDRRLRPVRPAPWLTDCHRGTFNPAAAANLLLVCGDTPEAERVAYWYDAATDERASVGFLQPGIVEFGFTSDGIGYTVTQEQVRPVSTIRFFDQAGQHETVLQYPGRISSLASMRS